MHAGFYDGSGNSNGSGGRHGTFFQVLPTPRPFARFPFFKTMNNRDRFGMLTLRPHTKVTQSSELHSLQLGERNQPWYQGGGVFQPWTAWQMEQAHWPTFYDSGVEFRYRPGVTLSGSSELLTPLHWQLMFDQFGLDGVDVQHRAVVAFCGGDLVIRRAASV